MPDVKLSLLPPDSPPASTAQIPLVDAGVTKQSTITQVASTIATLPQTISGTQTFNAGTFLDKGSQVYNVKAYGAVGDGVTDDYASIWAAVGAANTAGGGIIFFPKGTYSITSPIVLNNKSNLVFRGVERKSILQIPEASRGNFTNAFMIQGDNTGSNAGTDIDIEYLFFNGQYSTYSTQVSNRGGGVATGLRWVVRGCRFKDLSSFPIYNGVTSVDVKILNNFFEGPGSGSDNIGGGSGAANIEVAFNTYETTCTGNALDNTLGSYYDFHHNLIKGNNAVYFEAITVLNCHHNRSIAGGGFYAQSDKGYGGPNYTNSRYVTFLNNYISGGGSIGYKADTDAVKTTTVGGDVIIIGNTIVKPNTYGIHINGGSDGITPWGSGYTIIGNNVKDANETNVSSVNTGYGVIKPSGINIDAGINVLVADNVITDTRNTPQQFYGIMIGQTFTPAATNEPNNVTVANNHITGYVTAKLNLASPTYTSNYYEINDGVALNVSGIVAIANGGTGSATKNFVDLTTTQAIAGLKTFSDNLNIVTASADAVFTLRKGANRIGTLYAKANTLVLGEYFVSDVVGVDLANIRMGVGNTSPNSVLHISGPLATAYAAKTTTYAVTATDSVIDCTSGTFTVTLPTAVGCTGRQYVVKNSGTGQITVATTSAQTIDGATTYLLANQYQSLMCISDGANWKVI